MAVFQTETLKTILQTVWSEQGKSTSPILIQALFLYSLKIY